MLICKLSGTNLGETSQQQRFSSRVYVIYLSITNTTVQYQLYDTKQNRDIC